MFGGLNSNKCILISALELLMEKNLPGSLKAFDSPSEAKDIITPD